MLRRRRTEPFPHERGKFLLPTFDGQNGEAVTGSANRNQVHLIVVLLVAINMMDVESVIWLGVADLAGVVITLANGAAKRATECGGVFFIRS